MKRRKLNKTNRNNKTMYNHNSINPDVLIGQIWINANPRENGVKITELNSSHSSTDEKEEARFDNTWSNVNHSAANDNQVKTYNKQDNKNSLNGQGESSQKCDGITDYIYTNENNANLNNDLESLILNHEFRYLKMLQNQLVYGSDTSEDDYDEMMRLEDEYNNERRKYENDKETRNDIWAYARNNNRVLSDHDFMLLNIPNNETKDPLSDESDEPHRIATPPYNNYIPRLNLSAPTLPSVTEDTEPIKPVNKEKVIFKGNVPITPTSVNSWVESDTPEISKNLITWRKLSPKVQQINSDQISKPLPALTEENKNDKRFIVNGSEKLQVTIKHEYDAEDKSDKQADVEAIIETNRTVISQKSIDSPITPNKLNLSVSNNSNDTNMFHANSKNNSQYKSDKNVAELVDDTLFTNTSLDKSTQTDDLTYNVVPPLHLSLINSEHTQTTWLTRIFNGFCCCKSER